MNIRNKFEDLPSYLGIKTFTPTTYPYEYFNCSYYYRLGHYKSVKRLQTFSALGQANRSLLRYFNYLIFIFYRKPSLFYEENIFFQKFLQIFSQPSSRFHITVGDRLYLKNNFAVPGLPVDWIGALPHLRLISLLCITSSNNSLKETLVNSLLFKDVNYSSSCLKYKMVNPVTSVCDGIYRFHEYPNKPVGANSVINCNLLAYALLIDLNVFTIQDASLAFEKFFSKTDHPFIYSEDESNPITPAYHSLEYSIILSSQLSCIESSMIMSLTSVLSMSSNLKLFFMKVLFRFKRGYS